MCCWPLASAAETLRLGVFATELSRKGPGLLLRDILKGDDPQIMAVAEVVARAKADVLVLTGIDYDAGGAALQALMKVIADAGHSYAHSFAARPNAGRPTGLDLNADGRRGRAADAQGWALYQGQGGLAVLSRLPLDLDAVRDFSDVLWRDVPGAIWPETETGAPYYSGEAREVLRLSSVAHWDVPVILPDDQRLSVLAFAATPPVFDGAEDRNGLRNAAQIGFWGHYLDGALPRQARFPAVIMGKANADPVDGEARHEAIRGLLAHPKLQDPQPRSQGARAAANDAHVGDPALDTVDWWEEDNGPGNLRVDYILPTESLEIIRSGVLWSDPTLAPEDAAQEQAASRHRLVWVDLAL